MSRRPGPLWLAVVLAAACGGGEPAAEPVAEGSGPSDTAAPTPAVEPAQTSPRRAQPPLPASMQRTRGAIDFPHDPHVQLDCARCHDAVPGHVVHEEVACRDCHVATMPATPPPARAVCLSCHHGEDQARDCVQCHQPVAPLVAQRTVTMSVWNEPRTKALPFAHARHETNACTTCHRSRPELEASLECASCHERHHRPDATCMSCHAQPGEGVHALDAHLGCGGAGCHSDPVVQALPPSPPSCLVCHQDQVEHNPGRDCADCHQVRGPPDAARPPPGGYVHSAPRIRR